MKNSNILITGIIFGALFYGSIILLAFLVATLEKNNKSIAVGRDALWMNKINCPIGIQGHPSGAKCIKKGN